MQIRNLRKHKKLRSHLGESTLTYVGLLCWEVEIRGLVTFTINFVYTLWLRMVPTTFGYPLETRLIFFHTEGYPSTLRLTACTLPLVPVRPEVGVSDGVDPGFHGFYWTVISAMFLWKLKAPDTSFEDSIPDQTRKTIRIAHPISGFLVPLTYCWLSLNLSLLLQFQSIYT